MSAAWRRWRGLSASRRRGWGSATWPSTTLRTRCAAGLRRCSRGRLRRGSGRRCPWCRRGRACDRSRTWRRTACLPTIRFALSSPLTAQPVSGRARARASSAAPAACGEAARRAYGRRRRCRLLARGKRMGGETLSERPAALGPSWPSPQRRRSRLRSASRFAARGCDHAACDALPGPALAHRRDEPRARPAPQLRGRRQPAADAAASARTASSSTGTTATRRPPRGSRAPAPSLTSASPECAALIGSAPHAAASAATIPKASGKVLGTTSAAHAGSSSASSSCSRRPVNTTRSLELPAARQVALALARPAGCRGTRADGAAAARAARLLERPARRAPARVPARDRPPTRAAQRRSSRPGRRRSRRRPGALVASPQAPVATPRRSRSMPLLTISLPTNATSASRSGSSRADARAAPGRSRANAPASAGCSPSASPAASASAAPLRSRAASRVRQPRHARARAGRSA